MMVRVVNLHELPLAHGVAAKFMRERQAAHDSYHRVHLPSEGVSRLSANYAIWRAASHTVPFMAEFLGPRYILVHVTNKP